MDSLTKSQKRVIGLTFLVATAILIGAILLSIIDRAGRVEVEFITVPKDVNLSIGDATFKPGKRYLDLGKHRVTASRDGFESVSREIIVDRESVSFGFVLGGDSAEVEKYFADNPEETERLEVIGGIDSANEGRRLTANRPILTKLPYTDPGWLYSIDYGPMPDNPDDIFLSINKSSVSGRRDAIAWLRSNQVDPAAIDIHYDNYISPLVDRSRSERSFR